MRPTRAEIDLAAIRHNTRRIRAAVGPGPRIMAVVKADAYGHGAVPVSRAAVEAGATCLGVAIPEEGAELRAQGLATPIFVLGLCDPEQIPLLLEHDLIAAAATLEFARLLSARAAEAGRRATVVAKVDTGMGRVGVSPEAAPAFVRALAGLQGLELRGVFTHLAHADAPDKRHARGQLSRLSRLLEHLADEGLRLPWVSAANSATVMDLPAGHFNLVRAGIMLYGLPPSDSAGARDLRPAMALKTRVEYLKKVRRGATVGYGCTFTAAQDTWIATLPVGYADGYSRRHSNAAPVLVGGRRHRVAGRVCMDQIMVDLGPETEVQVGDEAVLVGRQGGEEITLTELATLAGTIHYELACAVSPRVPRVYVDADKDGSCRRP
jgi:alanine racemase